MVFVGMNYQKGRGKHVSAKVMILDDILLFLQQKMMFLFFLRTFAQ